MTDNFDQQLQHFPDSTRPDGGFTPGPWVAKGTDPNDGWDGWYIEDAHGNTVADAHGIQFDGTRQANARLIAAAPELLQALQLVAKDTILGDPWRETMEAAIRKATQGA